MFPSPPPFPPFDVEERIANGATTLEEIDPPLAAWLKRQHRLCMFQAWCLILGGLGLAFCLAVGIWNRH